MHTFSSIFKNYISLRLTPDVSKPHLCHMKDSLDEKRQSLHSDIRGRANGFAGVKKTQTQALVCPECVSAAGELASTGFLVEAANETLFEVHVCLE